MTTADLWHHYGRTRAQVDRAVPDSFYWNWGQDEGPGPELLGDLTDKCVADLGAGTARHAAHLATHYNPGRIDAVDASSGQNAMAAELYATLAPRLSLVHSDVIAHLRTRAEDYDALYSVFGAIDFTDPRELLPAAAKALRPGGRMVFATLAHYLSGAPAQPDITPARIPAKTPLGAEAFMNRWVLQEHVWMKALDEAGFTEITVQALPPGGGPRAATTLLLTALRPT